MTDSSLRAHITAAVLSWEGMTATPRRFGGAEYGLGGRENDPISLHRGRYIPRPWRIWDKWVAAGVARPHHIPPDSGWITVVDAERAGVSQAMAMSGRAYELALRQKGTRRPGTETDT